MYLIRIRAAMLISQSTHVARGWHAGRLKGYKDGRDTSSPACRRHFIGLGRAQMTGERENAAKKVHDAE